MRLEIIFYTEGLEFTQQLAKSGPLGGSETAVAMLADQLALKGHKVRVFCNTDERGRATQDPNGVEYCGVKKWQAMSQILRPDVLIVSRSINALMMPTWIETGMTYVWLHDTMTAEYERNLFGILHQVDSIVVNSQYALEQVRDAAPGITDWEDEAKRQGREFMRIKHLGLDTDYIPKKEKRDPRLLLYTSRPERGLDAALDVLDKVNEGRKDDDKYKLYVAGYVVPPELVGDSMRSYYAALEKRMKLNPCVRIVGKCTRSNLYMMMSQAHALLYPTNFPEIYCLTVTEAAACGLPVVTTKDFALTETAHSANWISDGEGGKLAYPEDENYIECAVKTLRQLEDPAIWDGYSKRGLGKNRTWKDVADDWESMIMADFQERLEANPLQVASALVQNSDLLAAKRMLADESFKPDNEKDWAQLGRQVDIDLAFLENDETYKAHYADADNGVKDEEAVKSRANNLRMRGIQGIMKDMKKLGEGFSVLDWGCNLGIACNMIRDAFPKAEITGYDLDQKCIDKAKTLAKEEQPDGSKEIVFTADIKELGDEHDVILVSEVLEHVPDVKEFMDKEILPRLKRGGFIVSTVPFGPWEANSFDLDDQRYHIRRFRNIDIEDMGKAMGKEINYSEALHAGSSNEQVNLGWGIAAFKWSGQLCPAFDYDRHIFTERPRQSVSACIINKDRGWELKRLSESIRPYVDEIIICDTGTTKEDAKRIQQEVADIVVEGPDPLKEGFSAARMASIKPATGDWILWIDSDESLANGHQLRKYLRVNGFAGYVLQQKHLTLDGAHEEPDNPTRLFRREGGGQFIGLIHEQLEYGPDVPLKPASILTDVYIQHDGYQNEQARRGRFKRNLPLLMRETAEMPSRLLTKVLMMRDFIQVGAAQYNKGQRLVGIKNIEKTVESYRRYFEKELHKGKYFHFALRYYQEAMRLLNRGIGMGFCVIASPREIRQEEANGSTMDCLLFDTVGEGLRFIESASRDALMEAARRKDGTPIYNKRPGSKRTPEGSPEVVEEQRKPVGGNKPD